MKKSLQDQQKTTLSGQDNRVYFSKATEDAIVRFNNTEDMDEREQIFRDHIHYPLDKLAENVINKFKFPYINQSFDDTKRQVVSFLVANLHKFDPSKGAKAFSYFSVIAKNHLILHNTNGYKAEKRNMSLSENGDSFLPIEDVLGLESPNVREHDDIQEFIGLMIVYWDANVSRHFKKRRDIEIAMAVLELFRRVNTIENFNKKALYLLIREMTDSKTTYITKVVNRMRELIMDQYLNFNQYGTLEPPDEEF